MLRLIVPLPKREVVVVLPSDERLIVPDPNLLVVTVWPPGPRVIAPLPNFDVVNVWPPGPRVIHPSPNLDVVNVCPPDVRVTKPLPNFDVVELPWTDGITTGTQGLSPAEAARAASSKPAVARRNVFMAEMLALHAARASAARRTQKASATRPGGVLSGP